MAAKKMITVEIKTIGGNTATADDNVLEGQGVAAYGNLKGFRAVNFTDADGKEIYIPYHAIDFATITSSMVQFTPADDPTCVTP